MESTPEALARAIRKTAKGLTVAITGAGVSVASGLPLFRGGSPDAIWTRDAMEIATWAFFRHDPVAWWSWFLDRFGHIADARPNAAHRALAELERWQKEQGGDLLVVTQNIDTLHEQAGSENLVKVHGTSDRLRCSRVGCGFGAPKGSIPLEAVDRTALIGAAKKGNVRQEDLPRCPECGALIRAHALLFDEYYTGHEDYGVRRVEEALGRMDLALFIGTSFSVGITDLALNMARVREIPSFSVDPVSSPPAGVVLVRGSAELVLPEVMRLLEMDESDQANEMDRG